MPNLQRSLSFCNPSTSRLYLIYATKPPEAKISVAPWDRINVETLKFLIDAAFEDRGRCVYDLSRPMRRANS